VIGIFSVLTLIIYSFNENCQQLMDTSRFLHFQSLGSRLSLRFKLALILFIAIQDLSSSNTTKPVQDKLIGLNISQPKPPQAEPVVVSKPPPSKPVKQTDLKTAVRR
jgi:hypothetical protein